MQVFAKILERMYLQKVCKFIRLLDYTGPGKNLSTFFYELGRNI